jgi:hypothetical protein
MKKNKEFSHFSKNSSFSVPAGPPIFFRFRGLTAHYEADRKPLARKMLPKILIFCRYGEARFEGIPVVGLLPPELPPSATKCLHVPQMDSPHSSIQSEN